VIVFPNRRAKQFFNDHLAHLSDKPLWAPDYYTITDFIKELSGLQVADQITLLSNYSGSIRNYQDRMRHLILSTITAKYYYLILTTLISTRVNAGKVIQKFVRTENR